MAATALTNAPARAGERLQHLFATAFSAAAGIWMSMRNRRSVAKLLEWDDRMLKDIGLTRHDVTSAMATPAADDPSRHLAAFRSERKSSRKGEVVAPGSLYRAAASRPTDRGTRVNAHPYY